MLHRGRVLRAIALSGVWGGAPQKRSGVWGGAPQKRSGMWGGSPKTNQSFFKQKVGVERVWAKSVWGQMPK